MFCYMSLKVFKLREIGLMLLWVFIYLLLLLLLWFSHFHFTVQTHFALSDSMHMPIRIGEQSIPRSLIELTCFWKKN
ncbi:hypothetical protein OIU76_021770, partial [Salix suchowensis]